MQYKDKITFVALERARYDPEIGKRVSEKETSITLPCNVTSPSIAKSVLLFGDLKTTDVIVHMKRPYLKKCSYYLINGNKYFFVKESLVKQSQLLVLRRDGDGSRN